MNTGDKLERVQSLLSLKRYPEARQLAMEILAEIPDFGFAQFFVALSFYYENNYKHAMEFVDQVLANNPEFDNAVMLKGNIYAQQGEFQEALNLFNAGIELSPNTANYYLQRASLLMRIEFMGKANKDLDKVLELDPGNVSAMRLKSNLKAQFAKRDEADHYLKTALEKDPNNLELLEEKATQEFSKGNFEESAELWQQCIQQDPLRAYFKEKYLDASLATNPIYKWLVIKFRAFHLVGYTIMAFDMFLIFFGGMMLREKNTGEAYYPYVKVGVQIFVVLSLAFWFTRMIGHALAKRKKWSLSWSNIILNRYFIGQLTICLALAAFLLYIETHDFNWMGAGVSLSILALMSIFFGRIPNPKMRRYTGYYLMAMYGLGAITLTTNLFDLSFLSWITNVFVFSLFGPVLLFAIIDKYSDKKVITLDETTSPKTNSKSSPQSKINKTSTSKTSNPIFSMVENFGFLILFVGTMLLGNLLGPNIVDKIRFGLIWSVLGICAVTALYFYWKKTNSTMLNFMDENRNTDEIFGRIARIWIAVFFAVLCIGFSTVAFINLSSPTAQQVELIKHGKDEEKPVTYIWVNYRDKELKLRPKKSDRDAIYGSENIEMTTHKSLFGVEYAKSFQQIN